MENRRIIVRTAGDCRRATNQERRRERRRERACERSFCYGRPRYCGPLGVSVLLSLLITQGMKAYKKRKQSKKEQSPAYEEPELTRRSDEPDGDEYSDVSPPPYTP